MPHRITAYQFTDPAFVVGSDAVVCVARLSELRAVLSPAEIEERSAATPRTGKRHG